MLPSPWFLVLQLDKLHGRDKEKEDKEKEKEEEAADGEGGEAAADDDETKIRDDEEAGAWGWWWEVLYKVQWVVGWDGRGGKGFVECRTGPWAWQGRRQSRAGLEQGKGPRGGGWVRAWAGCVCAACL